MKFVQNGDFIKTTIIQNFIKIAMGGFAAKVAIRIKPQPLLKIA